MADVIDQMTPEHQGSADSAAPLVRGSWPGMALLGTATAIAMAASAWLGYRNHVEPPAQQQSASAPSQGLVEPPAGEPRQAATDALASLAVPPAQSGSGPAQLAWPLWEFRLRQPIPPRDPSLTPPTWRLIGATLSGGKWSVIVLLQGSTVPEYFSVGQELPGGYRIKSIGDEDVTLAQGKRLMVLSYIGSR